MTDEEFMELAKAAARNAQGLRPLAAHVRELYGAIRTLQGEDNSFAYIAEVIQTARKDQTDPDQFMHRIKSYYHRDRKAADDTIIVRGRIRRQKVQIEPPAPAGAATPMVLTPAPPASLLLSQSAHEPSRLEVLAGEDTAVVAAYSTPVSGVPKLTSEKTRSGGGALTAAVHMRPGRRRLVSGG